MGLVLHISDYLILEEPSSHVVDWNSLINDVKNEEDPVFPVVECWDNGQQVFYSLMVIGCIGLCEVGLNSLVHILIQHVCAVVYDVGNM